MEYVLNDNLSKEELMNLGFTNHRKKYLYYQKTLHVYNNYFDMISLCISIKLDKDEHLTNEYKIMVIDELYLQPYLPFYDENAGCFREVLNIVKENFDKEMNTLVENGIFKKKDKVKTL